MKEKKCPLCGELKPVSEYHSYFSRSRNKVRIGNYCIPCANENAKERATKYYEENKQERLEYAKKYRSENKEKINKKRIHYDRRYRAELQDCYAAEQCAKMLKCTIAEVRSSPAILKAYKLNLKIKRKIYGTK